MIQHVVLSFNDIAPHTTLEEICEKVYFPRSLAVSKEGTRKQYRIAIKRFGLMLGRPATLADLDDDLMVMLLKYEIQHYKNSPYTANQKAGRFRTLWNWLARKNIVKTWPSFGELPCPRRLPRAWKEDELKRLYTACRMSRGLVSAVPAGLWWSALILTIWNTSERISATLSITWDNVNLEERWISIPGEDRKGGVTERGYRIWDETVEHLKDLKRYTRGQRVFPFVKCNGTLYRDFAAILRRADLPTDRKSKFHKIRVSHATWLKAMGGDATESLGHSSPAVTKRSYLDPSVLQTEEMPLFKLGLPKPLIESSDVSRCNHVPHD